jgi:uncharacterized protein (TIGR03085 family)
MTLARSEREQLCELLTELGPDRPTLCAGWTTRDLAAHLIARERRPLSTPGLAFRWLAGYTNRVRRRIATRPFPELVRTLRRPPWWTAPFDAATNGLEFFIHHEDVRRARPGWQPRELSAATMGFLWSRMRQLARLQLRRFPATVVIEALGHGELRTGRGGEQVLVRGDPAELAMFLTGRQRAAQVELEGPPHLTDRLATARLGL